jgi:hypothetical protein
MLPLLPVPVEFPVGELLPAAVEFGVRQTSGKIAGNTESPIAFSIALSNVAKSPSGLYSISYTYVTNASYPAVSPKKPSSSLVQLGDDSMLGAGSCAGGPSAEADELTAGDDETVAGEDGSAFGDDDAVAGENAVAAGKDVTSVGEVAVVGDGSIESDAIVGGDVTSDEKDEILVGGDVTSDGKDKI